jgi:pyruvate dehydrogenase E1 component alpha subunit
LNLAAAHKLPVVFVCENNGYGISVSQAKHQAIRDIADRAAGYGMPGVLVDGQDVLTVYEAASEAVHRARTGEGPTLIECKTYRFRGHHEGDPNQGERYRSREEIELWKQRCPIKKLAEKLLKEKIATQKKLDSIEKAITNELDQAVEFANASDYPAVEELYADVYATVQEREAR